MKKDIHPKYHENAKVICACGHTFATGSTMAEIKTELCSACHPFYTGKQKLVDAARRVEKFRAKVDAKAKVGEARGKKEKRATRAKTKAEKKATGEVKVKVGEKPAVKQPKKVKK